MGQSRMNKPHTQTLAAYGTQDTRRRHPQKNHTQTHTKQRKLKRGDVSKIKNNNI